MNHVNRQTKALFFSLISKVPLNLLCFFCSLLGNKLFSRFSYLSALAWPLIRAMRRIAVGCRCARRVLVGAACLVRSEPKIQPKVSDSLVNTWENLTVEDAEREGTETGRGRVLENCGEEISIYFLLSFSRTQKVDWDYSRGDAEKERRRAAGAPDMSPR